MLGRLVHNSGLIVVNINENITDHANFILDPKGHIVHNSGVVVKNFHDGLPPNPKPQLIDLWEGNTASTSNISTSSGGGVTGAEVL